MIKCERGGGRDVECCCDFELDASFELDGKGKWGVRKVMMVRSTSQFNISERHLSLNLPPEVRYHVSI